MKGMNIQRLCVMEFLENRDEAEKNHRSSNNR